MAGSGLATVMFTDLVGSTRMRERLGDNAADEIGVKHDRIIGDALSSTGGRLVKNLGDGALAVFDSSVDAVVAGQRIQEGVSIYNRQADEARHIGVRIGINAGEIATDNGDVIGLPVAVASRVCDKADGGHKDAGEQPHGASWGDTGFCHGLSLHPPHHTDRSDLSPTLYDRRAMGPAGPVCPHTRVGRVLATGLPGLQGVDAQAGGPGPRV